MKREPFVYEVCVEGVEGALAAERGGADRVELCAGLAEGGTTPSLGALERARSALTLPLVALVRPRAGNFVYTEEELAVQRRDVLAAKELDLHGVALGVLTAAGEIDVARTAELVELARPLRVTFHRAFDEVREPLRALETLVELGIERVLTSGGAPNAPAGSAMLRALIERAQQRITVLAGGGVRAHNVLELVRATGVREVHGSAYRLVDGARVPDEAAVRAVVRALA